MGYITPKKTTPPTNKPGDSFKRFHKAQPNRRAIPMIDAKRGKELVWASNFRELSIVGRGGDFY